MSDQIKELVKRLREVFVEDRGHGHTTEWTRNLDGHEAADALEAMAGEVEDLKSFFVGVEGPRLVKQMRGEVAALTAERDRLKAALDIAKAHAKQNQRARDLVSPYPNDHAKRIVWEKALYHEGKDLWDKLREALGGDA